ncbi:MAG: PAS domain S-box protein [bacterium]
MTDRKKKGVGNPSSSPLKPPSRRKKQYSSIKAGSFDERKQDADSIPEKEPAFDALINNLQGFVYSCENNPNWTMRYLSPQVENLLGYKPEELLNDAVIAYNDLIHPDDREEVRESVQVAVMDHEKFGLEYRIRNKNGKYLWVHEEGAGVYEKGVLRKLEGYVRDITDHKRDEQSLSRLHRAMKAIHDCNVALVHADDELVLENRICEILIETGLYRMAWVGYVESNKEIRRLRPSAVQGHDDGYLASFPRKWTRQNPSHCPSIVSIFTGETQIVRNLQDSKKKHRWVRAMLDRGHASVLAIPLISEDTPFAVLSVCSAKPDAFDDSEVELLTELAEDLAFGIVALRMREHRGKTLTELQQRTHDLEKRIREQACLYRILELYHDPDATVESILSSAVEIIPSGWLYPEITACRITVDGNSNRTKNFKDTRWKLDADIITDGKKSGTVEVLLLEEKPEQDIGLFLKEEKNLLKGIAYTLGGIIHRIRIKSEREEREIFIRTAMDSLPIGIAVNTVKPTVNFEYMNDNFLRFFRTTREAIAAPDSFWEAVYENPETREQIRKKVLDDATSGDPQRMDWEDVAITRKGEETTFISVRNTPIPNTNMIISTVHDVTQRKQAEVALRESEKKHRDLYDSIRDAILIVDSNRIILDCNPAFSDLFGFSLDEIKGKSTRIIFADAEGYVKVGKMLYKNSGEDKLLRIVCYRKKDGTKFFGETVFYYRKNAEGNIVGAIGFTRDITERMSAQRALAESEERFRLLAENAMDIVFRIRMSPEPSYDYVSPSIKVIFGYTQEELYSDFNVMMKIIAEDYYHKWILEYLSNPDDHLGGFVIECRHRDGSQRWMELNSTTVRDEQGRVVAIEGTARDVTSRITAEKELAESEENFRNLVEHSGDAIYVLQDYRFVFVNPQFERLFHTTAEEVRVKDFDFREYIAPESLELIRERRERRERGEPIPPTYEFRAKRKDGSVVDVETSISEIIYMGKSAILGILRDISERKQAESSHAWMMQSLEASPLAAMLADPDGNVHWINRQFETMLGFDLENAKGKPLASFFDFTVSNLEKPEQLMNILRGEVGRWYGDFTAFTRNGTGIPIYLAAASVKDTLDNVLGFTVTMIDRRDLEELEKVKVRLENELSQQFHLSQVGLLASGISHNLRNPLSVIMMGVSQLQQSIEMILRESPEDPVVLYDTLDNSTQMLEKVSQAADRINLITDEIMAYHQMNTQVEVAATDLNHVIQTDVGLLKADLDFKHKIETVLDLLPGHVWVKMRPSEISQIFLNLTANARDAMMNGGQRVMTVRSGISDDGSEAWFEVQDTGTGIPLEILEKIGQPFITTKRDDPKFKKGGSGTGLGLYMIKRLLDQHNGHFEIESKPGDTRLRIHLPATEQPAEGEQ